MDESKVAELRKQLAEKEAALAEAGGRGVELAEEIDRLRLEIGRETMEGPFGCRTCGTTDAFAATYPAYETQGIELYAQEGELRFEYDGVTDTADEAGENETYSCRHCGDTAETIEELVGLPAPPERWTWTGWYDGSDVTPEEPGKEWLAIEQDGEEYATIVLRVDASIFADDPAALDAARKEREERAERIVAALRRSG